MSEIIERLNAALDGRYRIERDVGAGASATVYLAWDVRHQRNVAVKVFDKASAGMDAERFAREIEVVAGFTHPHILPLHDSGAVDGVPFFVMPYIDGGTLRDRLNEGALSPTEAVLVTTQIADALRAAHEAGVLHRDVKPENIVLTQGHALLGDFGIAGSKRTKELDAGGGSTGSPAYMAPEQALGGSEPDVPADLYSLGCVLFEMLTGDPPYLGGSSVALVTAHLTEPIPRLRERGIEVVDEVQELIDTLLAKEPRDRPQSAAAVLKLLRRAASGQSGRAGGARAEEEARILDAIDGVREGGFRVVLVEGDAGLGKSSVLDAVRRRVTGAGTQVLYGAATRTSQTAYDAWAPILATAFDLDGVAGVDERRRRVLQALSSEEDAACAPLLNDILDLEIPETRFTEGMDGTSRAEVTREFVGRILRQSSDGRTLVVFIDDVQWMDGASWSLVLNALPGAGTVVGVFASRPGRDAVPDAAQQLLESDDTIQIELGPLDVEGTASVVESAIGGGPISAALAQWLQARSDGNPFYAREIALALVEAGDLEVFGGSVVASPSEVELRDMPLPAAVEDWILARVNRLSDAHRTLVEAASVLGRSFRTREIEVLAESDPARTDGPSDEAPVVELLGTLVGAQLLVQTRDGFAFTHQITRDQVYGTVEAPRRRELHRRFAEWLEGDEAVEGTVRYPRLAHHWRRAGDLERTIECLETAAEGMLRKGAFGDAADSMNRLLEVDRRQAQGGDPERRGRWHRMLAAAYFGDGKSFESAEHAAAALDAYGVKLPRSTAGWALLTLRQVLRQVVHLIRAPKPVALGTPAHRRMSDLVKAAAIQSDFRYTADETLQYAALMLFAVNLADRMEPDTGVAHAISPVAAFASMAGLRRLTERYFDYTRSIATRADDPRSLARIAVVESAVQFWSGELRGAYETVRAGEEIARSRGLRREIVELSGIATNVLMALGEHDEHRRRGEEFLRSAPGRGPTVPEIWGHLTLAQNQARVGRFEEADKHLARLRSYGGQVALQERAGYEAVEVLLNVRREEWGALRISVQRLSESLGVGSRTTLIFSHWQSFLALGDGRLALVERATGRDRDAELAEARRMLKAYEKFAGTYAIARPYLLTFRGRLSALEGQPEQGIGPLDSAREIALGRGDRYAAARALHWRALAEPASNSERARWLDTAEAEYEALDCRWDVGALQRAESGSEWREEW